MGEMNELNRAQNSFHSAPVVHLVNAGELNSTNEDFVGLNSKADKPAEALGNNGVHQCVHQLESGALIGQPSRLSQGPVGPGSWASHRGMSAMRGVYVC